MKNAIFLFRLFLILSLTIKATAQLILPVPSPPSNILNKRWNAHWITVPAATSEGYGVYLFRKKIQLDFKPNNFIIHVSADNRYKLFINEKLVSLGPARGDIAHWNYETIDIAPYLKSGNNIIAAQVWNEGEFRPEAQISYRTAFILQGSTPSEFIVNTNESWQCIKDNSFSPLKFNTNTYYVSGAGEIRNMETEVKNWQSEQFNASIWENAKQISFGVPKNIVGEFGTINGWMLVPSLIPQMELIDERLKNVVLTNGDIIIPFGFPSEKKEILIPSNKLVKIILDQNYLTNSYPNITFSGGKNASISVSYAEAMFDENHSKGNRNEIQNKNFVGRTDSLISDGSNFQKFTTLTYRTYRYLQLKIFTRDEPLILNDIFGTFTGYPFELKSATTTKDKEINDILTIGWRTARLCATETYIDCPYYEQLQYIGDSRIQALVSHYNSGDDRLVKNALNLMDFSRTPEGITLSRHPSYTPQIIPTFSLWYIGMLYDYCRYGTDLNFAKSKIGGTRQILDYFKTYQQKDGSLKNVPQWMFTDWVDNHKDWHAGIGPMSSNGTSALLDLQLLWAFQLAAEIEQKIGNEAFAHQYKKSIFKLKQTIKTKYWDSTKNLFADREEKDLYSQHTNALAILTGITTNSESKKIAKKLLTGKDIAPASIYFKYYLHQALIKAGLGNDYLNWLDKWRENIKLGLTTWAETSDLDKTRSDCHAWGSSPNIEFYRTILGIDSDDFGFSKVRIHPQLGKFTDIGGKIPHPKGSISVDYKFQNGTWKVQIELPQTITGSFIWKGRLFNLKSGLNKFIL